MLRFRFKVVENSYGSDELVGVRGTHITVRNHVLSRKITRARLYYIQPSQRVIDSSPLPAKVCAKSQCYISMNYE